MRRILVTTALFTLSLASSGFAQPNFVPLTNEPSMVVNAPPAIAGTTTTEETTSIIDSTIGAAFPVSRSGEVIDSHGSGAIPALPMQVVRLGNIAYISGGIGDEEVEQLKAQEHLYNFRVQIANQVGEYLTDVTFKLYDTKGKLLVSIEDAGPYVMMQLPFGTFEAEAISSIGNKRIKVKLPPNRTVKAQIRL
jgi:hypothetical protein